MQTRTKKTLVLVGAFVGLAVLARRFGPGTVDWEQRLERMPDSAPPKWVFTNVSAIRANTERILELLDENRAPTASA